MLHLRGRVHVTALWPLGYVDNDEGKLCGAGHEELAMVGTVLEDQHLAAHVSQITERSLAG